MRTSRVAFSIPVRVPPEFFLRPVWCTMYASVPACINRYGKRPRAKSHLVEIPAGRATLGLQPAHGDEFGWDNEFETHEVRVADFAIDNYNVTNRDFMLFVEAGGYSEPSLWDKEAWAWKKKEGVQHRLFGGAREICGCIARCLGRSGFRWTGRCM